MHYFLNKSRGNLWWNRFGWVALPAVLALAVLLFPAPSSRRAVRAGMDLCHGPFFALLAGGMFWALGPGAWTRFGAVGVWLLVSAFGLITEYAQAWVGRHASWEDVLANMLGAAAGILWLTPSISQGRKTLLRSLAAMLLFFAMISPLLILADTVMQSRQMPVLASFESPWELSRWSLQDCEVQRVPEHATSGEWALKVDLGTSIYPGLAMPEVPPDWTRYRELLLDVTLESPASLPVTVKLTDQLHNQETKDRFHQRAVLEQGPNRIRIPLRDVLSAPEGRLMDLSRMQMLELFCVKPNAPARIYLDNIRLIPQGRLMQSTPGEDAKKRK